MFGKNYLRQSYTAAMPFLFLTLLLGGLTNAKAVNLYGVSAPNQLVRFDSSAPGNPTTIGAISGLQPGENILDIDFRFRF